MVKLTEEELKQSDFFPHTKLDHENVETGKYYNFLDEGEWQEGVNEENEPFKFMVITVANRLGDKFSVKLNKTTLNNIVKVYGAETNDWVGKNLTFTVMDRGKFTYILGTPIEAPPTETPVKAPKTSIEPPLDEVAGDLNYILSVLSPIELKTRKKAVKDRYGDAVDDEQMTKMISADVRHEQKTLEKETGK